MLNWISQNPALFWGLIAAWVAVTLLLTIWMQRSTASSEDDPVIDGIKFMRDLIRNGLVKRVAMRPRFVPKTTDEKRSNMMAAQILADQADGNEGPGEQRHAPAPGERGYREPIRSIRVSVGQFTVILRRDGAVEAIETMPNGSISPAYPIPSEWAELISTLAFEIGKIRSEH